MYRHTQHNISFFYDKLLNLLLPYSLEFTTNGNYINDIWGNISPNPSAPITESTFRHINQMSGLAEIPVLGKNVDTVSESDSLIEPLPIVAESPLIIIKFNDTNTSNNSMADYSNDNNKNCYTNNEFVSNNRQNENDELYKFVINQVDNNGHNNSANINDINNNNNNIYKYNFEDNNDSTLIDDNDDTIPVVDDNEQFGDEDYDEKWPNSTRVGSF